MKPSSPQLDERRREPVEAALDIALTALRRIARGTADTTAQSASETAGKALTRIEALLPDKASGR